MKKRYIVAAVLLIAMGGYFYVEQKKPVVTRYTYKSKNIPSAFDGFRILQLSDVHNIKVDKKIIEQEHPDIIVVTGDLIDDRGAGGVETINKIRSIAPVYYVPGNHEEWRGDYQVQREDIKEAGAILLEDMSTVIVKDEQELVLTGVMDSDFSTTPDGQGRNFVQVFENLREPEKFQILLSHRPEKFTDYVAQRYPLVFSGHAHGGQWNLPFVGAVYAPNQGLFPEYTHGTYTDKDTTMVVSAGLGWTGIPLRIENRAEFVSVTLKKTN